MAGYPPDDYWYYPPPARPIRHPSPAPVYHHRHHNAWLNPEMNMGGLHRSRSQGHAPVPQVNIYQDIAQDAMQRSDPRYQPPSPTPSMSPSRRGRRSPLDDDLLSLRDELAMERLRSRSRGRSDAALFELDRARDAEKLEKEIELVRARDDRMRHEENERIEAAIAERKRHEEKEKKEKERAVEEWKLEQQKKKEKQAEEEKELRLKIKREKEEKEEKEKREEEEWLLKQKLKKEKQEREEKEAEAKAEEIMAKKMRKAGYTEHEIERALHPKDKKKVKEVKEVKEVKTIQFNQPTYPKIHKDFLSVDTLIYYNLPYEFDRSDPNYIIILREMDRHETEVLFEHTRRHRAKRLLLEEKKPEKKYAWVRRKSRSPSTGDVKVMEIVRR